MYSALILACRPDDKTSAENTSAGKFTYSGQKPKITAGDLEVEFAPELAWTIKWVAYKGAPLITPTGYNGTVINGWIDKDGVTHKWVGTGHRGEIIKEIVLKVDGKDYPLTRDGETSVPDNFTVQGKMFSLAKKSIIGPYLCDTLLKFNTDSIDESVNFNLIENEAKISLIYVFMHCFANDTDQWVTEVQGEILKDCFRNDNTNALKKDIRWIGIYSSKTQSGLVYVYPEIYKGTRKDSNFIWNRPSDNKLYFDAQIDKKKKDFSFAVSLVFFRSPEKEWLNRAENILSASFNIKADLSGNSAANDKEENE